MNISNIKCKWMLLIVFLVSVVILSQSLAVHGIEYRDDEIFYYKSTQEMLASGNIMSPTYFGEDRFQKPILFYWLVLLSYKVLGANWFAARFVSVVFAGLTLCLTWLTGKELFNRKTAWLSVVILMTIPLFFRHAKNVVPDMALNFFTVLSCYCAIRFIRDPSKKKFSYLFFLSCALGFMIKGFVPVVIPFLFLTVYSAISKKPDVLSKINFPLGLLILTLTIAPWFIYMITVHGDTYLNYMLVNETQNRLVAGDDVNIIIKVSSAFFRNSLFYIWTIFNYFAPWSIFALAALPVAFYRIVRKEEGYEPLLMMVTWFFIVFLFFSFIFYVMNHYILVLSTPFAILLSYFFLCEFDEKRKSGSFVIHARRILLQIFLCMGFFGFAFLNVFLAGSSPLWLAVYLTALCVMTFMIYKKREYLLAPLFLGLFIVFVQTQQTVFLNAGVSAHTTLQRFAATINDDRQENYVIGVGSHDIHEKEFQVYFDRNVKKAATSEDNETTEKLRDLFSTNDKVYCLITEKDYNKLLAGAEIAPVDIVQEEYIFRKRLYLDRNFFVSVLKLNKDKIHDYLMEKVILIKKEKNA